MIFGNNRDELRRMYADAWQKHQQGQPLSPLEDQIVQVIAEHPEFHAALVNLEQDFPIEAGATNPFLHMGLHLGLREQLATDRPAGIRAVHAAIIRKTGDPHAAEHRMIDCLAETLWEAQRANRPPDEAQYLDRLRKLA